MPTTATPDTAVPDTARPDTDIERDIAGAVDTLFEGHFAVLIVNSDVTTFEEVVRALGALFGYPPDDAYALALEAHHTGEAVVAVLARQPARAAVGALRRRHVPARMEPV